MEFKETKQEETPKNSSNNLARSKYNNTQNNFRKIIDPNYISRIEKPIRTMENFYRDESNSMNHIGMFNRSDLTGMDTEIKTTIQNLRNKSQLKQTFDEFSQRLDKEAEARRPVLDDDLWKVSH